jgi:lysophospholipase L1-like esterase
MLHHHSLALVIPVMAALGAALMSTLPVKADGPHVVREDIEWCDIWIPHSNDTALPRVLLIGDSITRAYYPEVEAKLTGKAYVARLASSKSVGDPTLLSEVALVLDECHFDVIHFNNGMHGWGYTEAEYQQHFPDLLATIRKHAPQAKLIWASTTPVHKAGHLEQLDARTQRVQERNRIAAEIVGKENIPVDDQFALVTGHPEYFSGDGVHLNQQGIAIQAAQVADSILKALGH